VAGFIGNPPMNLLPAAARSGVLESGDLRMPSPDGANGEVILGVRPERLSAAADDDSRPAFDVMIDVVEPLGSEVMVHGSRIGSATAADSATITARLAVGATPAAGERMRLAFDADAAHVFDAVTGSALRSP
jgi:ABC-type sugar transport system ATPase subunit